jgi:DNA-binding MarR family transcriptional regulator
MAATSSSSSFTNREGTPDSFGPPLIGALLRVPLQSVQQRMLDRLREQGFDDIDAAHMNVFQYPGPQGARPSELATRLRITKQALNYLLGELERLGYVERQPHPDDQRSKRVVLTARGIAMIEVMRDAVAEMEAEWSERLGTERFAQLRQLLVDLNELA